MTTNIEALLRESTWIKPKCFPDYPEGVIVEIDFHKVFTSDELDCQLGLLYRLKIAVDTDNNENIAIALAQCWLYTYHWVALDMGVDAVEEYMNTVDYNKESLMVLDGKPIELLSKIIGAAEQHNIPLHTALSEIL